MVGLLVTAVALCSLLAPAAGAQVIYDRVIHKKFGIFPSPDALRLSRGPFGAPGFGALGTPTCDTSVDASCTSLLALAPGGVVQHGEQDYLFFWGPSGSFPANYVAGMQAFLSGLAAADYSTGHTSGATGNPLSVLQQYYDNTGPGGAKSFIPLAIQNAGTIMDTSPYPNGGHSCTDTDPGPPVYHPANCVTGNDIQNAVTSYIAAHNSPTGVNVEYFVLTPPGVGSCDDSTSQSCFSSQYCAWHTFADTGTYQVTYADIPYGAGTPCDTGVTNLNNDGTDAVLTGFSHELAETMTDPLINAWQGSGGGSDEIGDKCAYQYVVGGLGNDTTGLPTQSAGNPYNTTLGGHNYLLQMEFDNSANNGAGGCTQWDTQTQPTASLSVPGSVTPGTPQSFGLTSVNAPAGVAYVNWDFGDGTKATSTGTATIMHTYQTAGPFTVTAIVTDNHGNEVKVTAPVGGGGKASPTLSASAPSSGTVGSVISAVSVSAALSGGASPTGTITYTVFGPQSTPPSVCSSGGSTVGTASASGDGTYNPSAGFTPASAGDYWWYASYGGDSGNNAATSTCGAGMPETVVGSGGGGVASLVVAVLPRHPAPRGAYTVTVSGSALSGGVFGLGQNESDVELYNGFGPCATTWAGERAKAAVGRAADIGHWLVAAGNFSFTEHRTATPSPFATVRFCGYVSRTGSLTDAHGTTYYTTT